MMTILSAVFTLIWSLACAASVSSEYWYVRKARHTTGAIVNLSRRKDYFYPVYAFKDAAGQEHEVYSHLGFASPKYAVGQTVGILYDPSDPENAKVDDPEYVWGLTTLTTLGAVLSAFFWVALWASARIWPDHRSAGANNP